MSLHSKFYIFWGVLFEGFTIENIAMNNLLRYETNFLKPVSQ